MQKVNVLTIQRISAEDRAKIEAVDPAVQLTDAGGWFDGEYPRNLAGLQRVTLSGAGRHGHREPARSVIACSPRRRSSLAAGHFRSICAPGRRS